MPQFTRKYINKIFERNCVAAILLKIQSIFSLWLPLKIDKVAITHLAMEIHFQNTVPKQNITKKYSKGNSLRVLSHIIILGKNAISHSKVGQSSPKPKNTEEHKNSIRTSNLPKMCNYSSFREKCVTYSCTRAHARTHAHTHVHTNAWCKL